METNARFTLLGFFMLAVIAAGFGFIYWLNHVGTFGEQAVYRIRFQHTVSGLQPGSAVLFNGIRVGEVTSLRLDPAQPRDVTATISIDRQTPVRADTRAEVLTQGLMGSPALSLQGGDSGAPALPAPGTEPPLLVADPAAGQDTMLAAREALRHVDAILVENAAPLRDTIANLKSFTDALARNSDRVDAIAKGLERMVGGGDKASPSIYDLTAPRDFPARDKAPDAQLLVEEPTAVLLLDTQRILLRTGTGADSSFEDSQWSDSLPKLFQARIVQGFENADYGRAERDREGFAPNFRLLVDIRAVHLLASPAPMAEVEFGAKLMDEDGRIVETRLFRATAPAHAVSAPEAAAAINVAFGAAVAELVRWTIGFLGT